MATPTLTPNSKEEQDEAYAPKSLLNAEYASAGIDQVEAFANDPVNSTKEKEENPTDSNAINYTGGGSSGEGSKTPFSFRGQLKKKGPFGALIALLVGGGGLLTIFTPGLAIVQLKEVLTDDLNDQLGAMDIRTTKVFKAKLSDLGKGPLCNKIVPVKCKFKGMSDRQIRKFREAGFTVDTGDNPKNSITRKTKVVSLAIEDSSGKTLTVTDPSKLNKMLGDRVIRNSLRKAFNPKFGGFYDAVSSKVFSKFRTSKSPKVTGDTDEARDRSVNDSVKGEAGNVDATKLGANDSGEALDKDGNVIDQSEADKAANFGTDQANRLNEGGTSTKSLFSSVAKNGATSIGKGLLITGAADVACSVKNAGRAVASTAKVVRSAQLARFAMVFLGFADQVKAGTATPEQAEYIGNKLTAVDTDQKILNETSKNTNDLIDNPDYGKNAFDSDGFKIASYNDAPNLSARSMSYTVGGTGLMGNLTSVNNFVASTVSDTGCRVIQNNFFRLGSLAVGIGVGAISLGASFYAQAGAGIAIGMALPLLENYLANMLAGTVVDAKTDGVDAGNAVFAGTAAVQGGTAAARGMKPQSKSEFKEYLAVTKSINDEYIAMETNDAKKTPFDIYNQYSFFGSFARKIIPATASSTASISSSLATIPKIFSAASSNILPNAKAVGVFNEERFSKCDDEGYDKLGIDADIFCNVRYGMSAEELAMDTDDVIDYMVNEGYIDGASGLPIPFRDYSKFLDECVNRTVGWGEDQTENSGDGKFCMGDSKMMSNFRVYTMDNSINEAMEYEGPSSGGLSVMTFNILGENQGIDNRNNGGLPIGTRNRAMQAIVEEKQPAIIGFQEVGVNQGDYMRANLTGYDYYPKKSDGDGRSDAIFWNSSMFSLADSGTYNFTKEGDSRIAPWVKLQSTSSGGSVYIFNTHTVAGNYAKERKKTIEILLSTINKVVKDGSPVVLTGDFNATDFIRGSGVDAGVSLSELPTSMIEAAGYSNTRKIATTKINDDYQSSHTNAGDPREKDSRSDRANKIDHVFVSSGITVSNWENVIDENSRVASDHTPIVASLAIPGITAGGENSAGSAPVSVDGYAFPVALSGLSSGIKVNQTKTLHWGNYAAFDLISKGGTAVYAITDGDIVKVNRNYTFGSGKPGKPCESITFKSKDGYYYWYGHIFKSTSKTSGIKAGEKIAEVADKSYGPLCQGGGPHLHIDRNKSRSLAGSQGDASFIPLLSKVYETAGGR